VLFATLFGLIGGAVGSALAGPAGEAVGSALGARLGGLVDHAIAGDEPVDPTTGAACVLSGPECIVCVLPAEPGNAALLFLH
jgi:hypothetical protein